MDQQSSTSLTYVIGLLEQQLRDLHTPLSLSWRSPRAISVDPIHARMDTTWPVWQPGDTARLRKNAPNWFYAELVVPAVKNGLELAGTPLMLFVNGWSPFTLWIDGVEQFKETHAWHATGPLAQPLAEPLIPGKTYHLVLCVEPTELPAGYNPAAIDANPLSCLTMATELGAAVMQLRIAAALASTEEECALVGRAAACVATDALAAQQWDEVLASITAMEQTLAPFAARAKALTVHLIGHSHIDMDWMWTWQDTEHCIRRDFKAVTDLMDDYQQLTFTHSQVPTYQVVEAQDPAVFAKVQQRIREGRWENAAGTWVEGDLHMADGESIARHMLYAADWTQAHLDSKAKVLWEPDTFGHPGNMPQLAKLGELDYYFHWRTNPGREKNWPARYWEGVDGTRILAFSPAGGYNGSLRPEEVVNHVLNGLEFNLPHALHAWGLGDHGGALSRFMLELLSWYEHKPLVPTFTFSTIEKVAAALEGALERLPSNKGETYTLFEGCFTTHASVKRYNRQCEGALLTAEALCALAGLNRTTILRDAWTKMLFNHFHDIMDGAAVHDSYINAHQRAEDALATAADATGEALTALVSPAADGATLVLVNPLGFERTEPMRVTLPEGSAALRDSDGTVTPIQRLGAEYVFIAKRVPAFARKCYEILTDVPTGLEMPEVSVSEDDGYFTVETAYARSRISKCSGAIGSYFDKLLCRELVPYGVPKHLTHVPTTRQELAMNVFQILDEAPNPMSAWLINDILREESLLRNAAVTLVERGPVFARFHVKHAFRASVIDEDVIYYQQFPRVDFLANIDWHERGNDQVGVPQLKVSFGAALTATRARFDGPFVITERPSDGLEQPTQKWVDLTGDEGGLALYNDSKYGADALGSRLRLTLLRNPYSPDPEPDNGQHTVRFAFAPHGAVMTNAELVRAGMAFNRPPVAACAATPVTPTSPLLVMEGADTIVCTALRIAEHSEKTLLRFFATSGEPAEMTFTLGSGITQAEEVNFLEHSTGASVQLGQGAVTVTFHPYEVKTFLVDYRA